MRDLLGIMEHVMETLCASRSPEDATDEVFAFLRTMMPLRFMLLGFFDRPLERSFVLSVTDKEQTKRLYRYYPFTPEQKQAARSLNFFTPSANAEKGQQGIRAAHHVIDSREHPLFPLFVNADFFVEPPFYLYRFSHPNMQQGSGTFGFDPGVSLPADLADILGVLQLPFNIFIGNQFRYWQLSQVSQMVAEDNARLRKEALGLSHTEIIGETGGLKEVVERLRQVAPLDVSLLIQGETGTGKEVLARAAHELSARRKGPFVAVNCGAIPPSLIDNELFGHGKGSFTGATETYRGRFERASGGTLFLDEVGELPPEAQARLLRVLEERVVERLGGSQPIPVDFRLIAATHRDLKSMAESGTFREDLYYRLAVVPLRLPPLRERKRDIPLLARHFAARSARRFGTLPPDIPAEELTRLCAHPWPGNVRELQNVVEEAVALSLSGPLRFWPERQPAALSGTPPVAPPPTDLFPFEAMIKCYLQNTLARCNGKIQGPHSAAELLAIHPNTLRTKLDKYGIPYGRQEKKK